jgi:hypothetical protein
MVITDKASIQTSMQIADYLLCADCEQLFSKNGENYVMTQVFDGTNFPLLDFLRTKNGVTLTEFVAYRQSDTQSIDRDKLVYFALSVFWRASVHIWKQRGGQPITIDLGKTYSEAVRQYLLGQARSPANVTVAVIVCTDSLTQESFFAPNRGFRGDYSTYNFAAKGLLFFLTLGKLIPPQIRRLCTMTGAERFISSRDCQQKVAQGFLRLEQQQRKRNW